MRSVTNSMGSVVKGMDKAMESMNLERVSLDLLRSKANPSFYAVVSLTKFCEGVFVVQDQTVRAVTLWRTLTIQISMVMDKFESQFSDLDVQTSYMESTMSDTTALTTPQDQVDSLINQVADENGLEIQQKVGESKVPQAAPAQATPALAEAPLEEDGKLAERLRALRVSHPPVVIHGECPVLIRGCSQRYRDGN